MYRIKEKEKLVVKKAIEEISDYSIQKLLLGKLKVREDKVLEGHPEIQFSI